MSEEPSELGLKYFSPNYGEHLKGQLVGEGEHWEYSLAQTVMNVHNGVKRQTVNLEKVLIYQQRERIPDSGIPPTVIFVTATTAIPYAFAIRECWKTAYPDEQPPKFFFIDVSIKKFGDEYRRGIGTVDILSEEEKEIINLVQVDKLKWVGQKYNSFDNAAVFDELRNTGTTFQECQKQLQLAGFSNVNYMVGTWGDPTWDRGMPNTDRPVIRKGKESGTPYRPLIVQGNEDSRNIISDMKNLGRMMGEQILSHSTDATGK